MSIVRFLVTFISVNLRSQLYYHCYITLYKPNTAVTVTSDFTTSFRYCVPILLNISCHYKIFRINGYYFIFIFIKTYYYFFRAVHYCPRLWYIKFGVLPNCAINLYLQNLQTKTRTRFAYSSHSSTHLMTIYVLSEVFAVLPYLGCHKIQQIILCQFDHKYLVLYTCIKCCAIYKKSNEVICIKDDVCL